MGCTLMGNSRLSLSHHGGSSGLSWPAASSQRSRLPPRREGFASSIRSPHTLPPPATWYATAPSSADPGADRVARAFPDC